MIQKGYTRISFIDIDSKDEKVIHEGDSHSTEHKEYRVLYSKSVPFSSMQVLPLIATGIVGVTGDQSLVEAMSAKKLVTYECVNHKKAFANGYLIAVQREISEMALEGALGKNVLLLARFLIKPTYRCDLVEYKLGEVSTLLKNINVVEALKNINRQLVEKSKYFASIEKMLTSNVLPYIEGQHVKKPSPSETLAMSSSKESSDSHSLTTDANEHQNPSSKSNAPPHESSFNGALIREELKKAIQVGIKATTSLTKKKIGAFLLNELEGAEKDLNSSSFEDILYAIERAFSHSRNNLLRRDWVKKMPDSYRAAFPHLEKAREQLKSTKGKTLLEINQVIKDAGNKEYKKNYYNTYKFFQQSLEKFTLEEIQNKAKVKGIKIKPSAT